MNDIKIVNYNKIYAEKLADMWNQSRESWGSSTLHTAESVIDSEENAEHSTVFLALHKDEVVGYCSFGEYSHDEGASYIPTLNVRPDYIGKKIGKKLLLHCIDIAIKEKWPRLDLFTWPGNDKAVPLYKKCGFFWEKRDDTTHLMNFLPYIFKTDALKSYFNEIDWYQDNKREIKVESDGRAVGDFEFYDYIWQKDDKDLRLTFEKSGRGLSCIETNDFRITTIIDKHSLIIGQSYQIKYQIINKSGKALTIELLGENDKNIEFDFSCSTDVTNTFETTASFKLKPVKDEQNESKTHPCVTTIIKINGKQAIFKTGIMPKDPLKIEIANENDCKYLNTENDCYLNIESNIDEDITISFIMPSTDNISFNNKTIDLSLKPKEKSSVKLSCFVNKNDFYHESVLITIKTQSDQYTFKAPISAAFRGVNGRFYGTSKNHYSLYSGVYSVRVSKNNNLVLFTKMGGSDYELIYFRVPRLGKPFTDELNNKQADKVMYDIKEDSMELRLDFSTNKHPSILLTYVIELFNNGVLEAYLIFNNTSSHTKTLFLNLDMHVEFNETYMAYNNKVLKTGSTEVVYPTALSNEKITENWVFSNSKTIGIGWFKQYKATTHHNDFIVDCGEINIKANSSFATKPIVASIDTFKSYQEFRRYMGNTPEQQKEQEVTEISLNKKNPIIKDALTIEIDEAKAVELNGELKVTSLNNTVSLDCQTIDFNEDNKAQVNVPVQNKKLTDTIRLNITLNNKRSVINKVVFFKDTKDISYKTYNEQNKTVHEISNDLISIKASPEYCSGIFSLKYCDAEWLDHSFPNSCIKSWWNDFVGGSTFLPNRMSFTAVNKEHKEVEFVRVQDNFSNEWQGLKSTLIIKQNDKHKGIIIEDYFLLLDNVPVLCNFAVVKNVSGKYFYKQSFVRQSFVKPATDLKTNFVCHDGNINRNQFFDDSIEIIAPKYCVTHCNDSESKLSFIYNKDSNNFVIMNKEAPCNYLNYKLNIENNSSIVIKPLFYVLSDTNYDIRNLSDILNIRLPKEHK